MEPYLSITLQSIQDPRDPLERARRIELWRFAQDHGVTEISRDDMPAPLMRNILRSKGITNIAVPDRPLGTNYQMRTTPTSHKSVSAPAKRERDQVAVVDADHDLMRQWRERQAPVVEAKPVSEMNITELRKECKRRGIKMARTDNMQTLRAKLNGE